MTFSVAHLGFVIGCSHHGTLSRPLLFKNMWLVVEHIPRALRFVSRKINVRVTNLRSPKGLFLCIYFSLSWSSRFWNGRGKRGSLIANVKGPWHHSSSSSYFLFVFFLFVFNFFFWPYVVIIMKKEGKKKGRRSHEEDSQTCPFWTYINTSTFWCMLASLGPCLVYT